jgi:hypothetical protein
VHQLSDCQVYKAASSLKYYRKQVTNDTSGHVTWGSGAELWMPADGTRHVLTAVAPTIMSVGERASERVAGD